MVVVFHYINKRMSSHRRNDSVGRLRDVHQLDGAMLVGYGIKFHEDMAFLTNKLAKEISGRELLRKLYPTSGSSKAALKPNAEHRDEALAAIEQEGDQFVANRVLSASMTYAEIPVEHRNNILKAHAQLNGLLHEPTRNRSIRSTQPKSISDRLTL